MPRKKIDTVQVQVSPVVEVIEEIKPQKHIIMIKRNQSVPHVPIPVAFPVGEIRYWESTDDITYSYETGHQIYMDNFVNRAIQISKDVWIPRESTRKWVENLPKALLPDGYFASDILTFDEVE